MHNTLLVWVVVGMQINRETWGVSQKIISPFPLFFFCFPLLEKPVVPLTLARALINCKSYILGSSRSDSSSTGAFLEALLSEVMSLNV